MERAEKATGYFLLAVGLVFIILPACLALWVFLSGTQIPQLIPQPTGADSDFHRALVAFSNACLIFFLFIIMVWAGSIMTTRGITLIKDEKPKTKVPH
ncbi:MAG: hypothetical protein QXJ02_05930 [Candidatus Bathyarchaeia archaeon]